MLLTPDATHGERAMNDGKIGFIGLGVMGEPMCRNIANKSGRPVLLRHRSQAR